MLVVILFVLVISARNQLTSLEGAPKEVEGLFICSNNSVEFTEEQVREVCNVKGNVYV